VATERLRQLGERLEADFDAYEADEGRLPGLTPARRACLIRQLVDSSRVNMYVEHLRTASLSPQAADPSDAWFNPIKAAIIRHREGDDDEAFWLVFLRTHFGKHRRAGWRYVREVYGALGSGEAWTWRRVAADIDGFRDWLDAHRSQLSDPSLPHGFGNHRKYESLAGWTDAGTGSVVASYVAWVGEPPEHHSRFGEALASVGNDPQAAFDILYRSMGVIQRFGRLARFDYLSMVGKVGLASVHPGKAYLQGSTGPLKGARLLFQSAGEPDLSVAALEGKAAALRVHLGVTFDVMEDALCNWQKSPAQFRPFRG
jgi:Alpha-glutamyl/putrescinyl thymine pyrophosphorylase clade 3